MIYSDPFHGVHLVCSEFVWHFGFVWFCCIPKSDGQLEIYMNFRQVHLEDGNMMNHLWEIQGKTVKYGKLTEVLRRYTLQ